MRRYRLIDRPTISVFLHGYGWRYRPEEKHGRATALVLYGLAGPRHYVFQLGLGWDDDNPLRPWPWLVLGRSPKGRLCACLSFCGIFVNLHVSPPATAAAAAEVAPPPNVSMSTIEFDFARPGLAGHPLAPEALSVARALREHLGEIAEAHGLYADACEDGSIALGLHGSGWRLGVFIDHVPNGTGWHVVTASRYGQEPIMKMGIDVPEIAATVERVAAACAAIDSPRPPPAAP